MTDEAIDIPFSTNAPDAAKSIAGLRRELQQTLTIEEQARQKNDALAASERRLADTMRRGVSEGRAMRQEIERLTSARGRLGRAPSEFRSNNPTRGIGAGGSAFGGSGHGSAASSAVGRIGGHLGYLAGIPGVNERTGMMAAGMASGFGGAGLAAIGAAILPVGAAVAGAAISLARASAKMEIAADISKGTAMGLKALADAERAGTAARHGNARSGFETYGDDLAKLVGRGGSASEASLLMRNGNPDAAAGLASAQLLDPKIRGDVVAAARRASATGEVSFSQAIEFFRSNQIGLGGNETETVGGIIGAARGTRALDAGEVGFIEQNQGGKVGRGLASSRAARGRLAAASMGAGLDTDSTLNAYAGDRQGIEDPMRGPTDEARASLSEAVNALRESAEQQGVVADTFEKLLAKWGVGAGSSRQRAARVAGAASSAAGVP